MLRDFWWGKNQLISLVMDTPSRHNQCLSLYHKAFGKATRPDRGIPINLDFTANSMALTISRES